MSELAVILLNYHRTGDTLDCLRSLAASTFRDFKVYLLDFTQTDEKYYADLVKDLCLFRAAENRGYTGNNNFLVRQALRDVCAWIMVLNEDTIVEPHCLEWLVKAGRSAPDIGLVGPLVLNFDGSRTIQSAGGILDSNWRFIHRAMNTAENNQFTDLEEVDWVSGCGFLVRADAIEGDLFDERYFMYCEETDLALRMRRNGWRIAFEPRARLAHKGVSVDYQPSPLVSYYMTRNSLYQLAWNAAPWFSRVNLLLYYLKSVLSFTIKPKWRGRKAHRDAMWQGILDFFAGRTGPKA